MTFLFSNCCGSSFLIFNCCICVSFVIPEDVASLLFFFTTRRAATRGGGKRGRRPPKQKFHPPKISSMPTQSPLLLLESNFFLESNRKPGNKSNNLGRWPVLFFFEINRKLGVEKFRATTFFFRESTENLEKSKPTQKCWPPKMKFCPLTTGFCLRHWLPVNSWMHCRILVAKIAVLFFLCKAFPSVLSSSVLAVCTGLKLGIKLKHSQELKLAPQADSCLFRY